MAENEINVAREPMEVSLQNGLNQNNGGKNLADAASMDLESSKNGSQHEANGDSSLTDGGSMGQVSRGIDRKYAVMSTSPESYSYNMSFPHRGYCVIFNQEKFEPQLNLNERSGTNRDRDQMRLTFSKLGFDVIVHNDLTVGKITEKLDEMCYDEEKCRKHEQSDCFVVIFMSHGEDGILYGRDRSFKVEELYERFKANHCPSLAGKPKMFFIQACRGDGLDAGTTLVRANPYDETDSGPIHYKIPNTTDFLVCFSTVSGHYSWRNTTNGSWFIQSIASVFAQEALHKDVLSMMTSVNRTMINNFESNCPKSPDMHGKKQSACILSTLMRNVYLKPKH